MHGTQGQSIVWQTSRKLSLEALIQQALSDTAARVAAATLFGGDGFPKKSDLASHGLTEINYLALQHSEPSVQAVPKGIIYSIPGGAASNFALGILMADLSVRRDKLRQRGSRAPINVFLMIHGAIAPNPPIYWDFKAPVGEPLAPPDMLTEKCELFRQGFHAHNMNARGNFLLGQRWYEKLSCGGGGENTLDTREQAKQTYFQLKSWVEQEQIPLNFYFVEVIAAVTGLPYVRVFNDQWPYDQYAEEIESLYHFSRPGDDYRSSLEEERDAQFSCRDYPVHKILSFSALNDVLRLVMDRGEDIVGIGCSDARQGLCISDVHAQYGDSVAAAGTPGPGLRDPRREHMAGHSEPIGLIMLGANMQRVVCYLITKQFWIARREPQVYPALFSQAWPFLINIPYSTWTRNAKTLGRSLEQLFCVIDQNYRGGMNPFFFTPRVYLSNHVETCEVVMRGDRPLKGLQFLYPSELEDIVRGIRPGYAAFKLNLAGWGMSSRHVRAHYDRRSVDAIQFASTLKGNTEPEGAMVVNTVLRSNALARVGKVWPFGRRTLGVRVPSMQYRAGRMEMDRVNA
jgi:hypothetical protein